MKQDPPCPFCHPRILARYDKHERPRSPTKHKGHHYISTLDQVYVSDTIPASVILLPDAVTDHFPVLAELWAGIGRVRPGKGLEIVSKRNLASINSAAFRAELRGLGVNNWPAPPPGMSVDDLIYDFYSVLDPIIDRHAPEKTFKVRRDTSCLYLSKETTGGNENA